MFPSKSWTLSAGLLALLLAGCGGDSINDQRNSRREAPAKPIWQAGVFESSERFYGKCAVPQTGTDPFTGLAYTDSPGSLMHEKLWLRSAFNEIYLWYNRAADVDPAELALDEYFRELMVPEDRFSYMQSARHFEASEQGRELGYGIQWAFESQPDQLVVRVADVGNNSPYYGDLRRGDTLEGLNDHALADLAHDDYGLLWQGLFPAEGNEVHVFSFRRENRDEPLEMTLSAAEIDLPTVPRQIILPGQSGPVGYLQFNRHLAKSEAELVEAVEQLHMEAVTDLILDLRYNGGGQLDVASRLAYMVAGPGLTAGQVFYQLQFNDKVGADNPFTSESAVPFHTSTSSNASQDPHGLPSLHLQRVFVLTGRETCSASEALINGLKGVGVEVYQFGASTCGKPYGWYPLQNCGKVYGFPMFKGANMLGYGDYTEGFIPSDGVEPRAENILPGCTVADDFQHELGDPAEAVLAAALYFREHGACPEDVDAVIPMLLQLEAPQSAPDWRFSRPQSILQQRPQ